MKPGALLVTRNFPPQIGGTCTLFSELYRRGASDCTVILTSENSQAGSVDDAFGCEIVRRPFEPRSWMKPFEWVELGLRRFPDARRLLKRRGFNEIHCGTTIPEGVVGLAAKRWIGARLVLWVHGEDVEFFRRCRVEAPIQRWMLRAADRVFTISENTARICRELGADEAKLRIVHPGVDLSTFRPDPAGAAEVRRRFQIGDAPLLATIGRLQKRKGHDKVLEALPRIRTRVLNIKYLIVGDSSGAPPGDAEDLRSLVGSLGLQDAVTFVGAVHHDQLRAFYSAADVFVMPNREVKGEVEGFGMTFLEAAACGKASIAGNSGGAVDAVLHEQTGLLVDGESSAAVANAVLRLLSDEPLRTTLNDAALKRADHFSWDRVYERFEAALAD